MLGIIIALISGALMSLQGVFNTGVTKQTSLWVSASFVQLTGFLACLILWFFVDRGKTGFTSLTQVSHKYMLLGGIIGAFITATVVLSMNRLGPAKAVLLIVISQILVAYIIELMGLFGSDKTPFHWSKLIGVLVSIAGIVIFQWKS